MNPQREDYMNLSEIMNDGTQHVEQRMVLLKSAQPATKTLFDYLQTPAAKDVLAKFGFSA